jgi:hypothetical protein
MLLSFGATAIFFPSVRQISRRRSSSLFATRQKAEKKIIRLHHRRVRFSQKLLLFRMGILRDFHPRLIVPEIAGINCSVQHGPQADGGKDIDCLVVPLSPSWQSACC